MRHESVRRHRDVLSRTLRFYSTALIIGAILVGLIAALQTLAHAQRSAPGAGRGFLIDKHVAAGLACGACHVEHVPMASVSATKCLTCHGETYGGLGKRTAASMPNPHESHRGEEPCGSCHRVHSASVNLCNQCHSFDMTTP